MKQITTVSFATMLLILLMGCQDNPKIEPIPHYPRSQPIPIDSSLQRSAEQEIQSALHSSDEVLRANAIETLRDTHLPHADDQIVALLNDPSLLVRKAAAMAVGELRIQSALGKLQPLLNLDPNVSPQEGAAADQERMATIFAMHRLGNTAYTHEFEKDAFDARDTVRRDTVFILGLLGEKSAIPILAKVLHEDKDVNVRLMAGEALWRLGDERGEDALLAATISKYASDQMIAALALAAPRDTRVLGHIESMFQNEHMEVNLVCARAAGMLGNDEGYGYAISGARNVDPRQRSLAAMAFGGIGRSDAQPRLAKLLKDDNADVRLAAAKALVEIAQGQR